MVWINLRFFYERELATLNLQRYNSCFSKKKKTNLFFLIFYRIFDSNNIRSANIQQFTKLTGYQLTLLFMMTLNGCVH